MNRAELVDIISERMQVKKTYADQFIAAFTDIVKTSVKKGEDVKLVGFGTFTKIKRKARAGRNPQTGKAIKIPAATTVKFRVGEEFKALVK